jgi:hypothetical protein
MNQSTDNSSADCGISGSATDEDEEDEHEEVEDEADDDDDELIVGAAPRC